MENRKRRNNTRSKNPKRRKPVVGKVWPKILKVTEKGSSRFESERAKITRILLVVCALVLLMLTLYAIVRDDKSILVEILSLVKVLLIAFGGWAIGRSM